MPRIITIAREYGSGGRLIAQKVAQKVGLVYYDNEVIDLAAREMGMDVDAIRKVANKNHLALCIQCHLPLFHYH